MKVLYLIDAQGGGAMTHILDLAQRLPENNIASEILFFTEGPSIKEARERNIPLHFILKKGRLAFVWKLYRYLRTNPYDILHTHTIDGNFFGRLAGKFAGVPVLLTTVHSHIIDEHKGLKKFYMSDYIRYIVDISLSRWSKNLIVVSETIRERLMGHGINSDKIRVIENGVDTDKFQPNSQPLLDVRKELGIPMEAHVVGIIGRMVPVKNHDLFLKAAAEVMKRKKDVFFLIVGNGPLMIQIQSHARSLNLGDRVIFTGWRADIARIIAAFNVLVACSQIEGHNIVVLEAMACGKPVIGTNVRGINTIVRDGQNGILVPPGDVTALTKAILDLLQDPEKAKAMGDSGREYVLARYSVDRMVEKHLKIYREIYHPLEQS